MINAAQQNAAIMTYIKKYYNVIRKQGKGGAIGNKLTEKLGRLLMKRHDKKYLKLLRKLTLEHKFFERYIDDETDGLVSVDP